MLCSRFCRYQQRRQNRSSSNHELLDEPEEQTNFSQWQTAMIVLGRCPHAPFSLSTLWCRSPRPSCLPPFVLPCLLSCIISQELRDKTTCCTWAGGTGSEGDISSAFYGMGWEDLTYEDQYLAEVNLEDLEHTSGEWQEYWLVGIQAAREASRLQGLSQTNVCSSKRVCAYTTQIPVWSGRKALNNL